jgi:hypothetical protein
MGQPHRPTADGLPEAFRRLGDRWRPEKTTPTVERDCESGDRPSNGPCPPEGIDTREEVQPQQDIAGQNGHIRTGTLRYWWDDHQAAGCSSSPSWQQAIVQSA